MKLEIKVDRIVMEPKGREKADDELSGVCESKVW